MRTRAHNALPLLLPCLECRQISLSYSCSCAARREGKGQGGGQSCVRDACAFHAWLADVHLVNLVAGELHSHHIRVLNLVAGEVSKSLM